MHVPIKNPFNCVTEFLSTLDCILLALEAIFTWPNLYDMETLNIAHCLQLDLELAVGEYTRKEINVERENELVGGQWR